MKRYYYDVIVVGGGPAGMGAGISACKNGSRVLIIERESKLGGILKQCIHSGFGLHHFGEELTGPEYAYRFIKDVEALRNNGALEVLTETFVIDVKSNIVTIKNSAGIKSLTCGSVVLSMGCRERTAGAISLAGTRPSGVWTAGQVQKWVNMYGVLPCKNPIILGSGDIGLIMARRLTFEGAKPSMVLEVQPKSSGLNRNIKQCLDDFDIPLYLNTTVVEVLGYPKITGVIIAEVDSHMNPIEETKKHITCDGLILSVGLIPETDLVRGVKMNPRTNSAVVNEYR
jgi:thioredoxin reductase